MHIWPSAVLSLIMLVVAIGLMVWHLRSWQALRVQPLEEGEEAFYWRQFRRRMQTSGMLGILAVGLFVGQLVSLSPVFQACYWGGMLLLTVWLGLLALADLTATRHHFRRLQQDYLVEEAKLQAELRRLEGHRGNGQAKGSKK